MASANWKKLTTQAAGALYVHLDKTARLSHNHSNEEIDKAKTKENYCIGKKSFGEAIRALKERTKEVDAILPPKRRRKDRITCCMIEYPCPQVIADAGRADEFFSAMHEACKSFFGSENVHCTFVHKDEVHEYLDSRSKDKENARKTSLFHAHTMVSTMTPKGINGKAFETKERLKAFNKLINDMCLRRFGIEYNTHEKARHQSVEEMKIESRIAELEQNLEQIQKHISSLSALAEGKQKELIAASDAVKVLEEFVRSSRLTLAPEGIQETTRGFGSKKETVVIAPKDLFNETLMMANTKEGVLTAFTEVQAIIARLDDKITGKDKQELQEEISGLKETVLKLKKELKKTQKYSEQIERMKEVLQAINPESAKEFIAEWQRQEQKQLQTPKIQR